MFLIRFVVFALALTGSLYSFAQDIETPPAPVAEGAVETPALVSLGQSIFIRLLSVLPEPASSGVDASCPLENDVPKCFDPDVVRLTTLESTATAAAIETRLLTLNIVEGYIALISAVGSGQVPLSENETKSLRDTLEEAGALGEVITIAKGVVTAVIPLPPILTQAGFAVMNQLITHINQSQSTEEQSKALLSGAAVVERMIADLIQETPQIYEIYRLGRNAELITLEEELALAGLPEAASSTDSESGTEITPANDGVPPAAPRTVAAIETEIAAVREDIRGFHQDLTTYVVLLNQRDTATKILAEAATQTLAEGPDNASPQNNSQVAVERVRRSVKILKFFQDLVSNKSN